jgi:RAT1-interacting protein
MKEVMMVDGVVYMINEHKLNDEGGGSDQQSYYGHSYEALLTNPAGFIPVNTNQQWVAVVKANLNHTRLILGGEVDCVDPDTFHRVQQQQQHLEQIQPDRFVEIKTCIAPASDRERYTLHRYKMLKFWLQSCERFTCPLPHFIVCWDTER